MAELVIESDRLKTTWLQHELMQSRDLQHTPPVSKRQPTIRNLSSAGRGTVRRFPTNGQHGNSRDGVVTMAALPTQQQQLQHNSLPTDGGCLAFPQVAMKGIYNSSRLQELPAGYFSNGDLWLSSKGDIVRSKSVNDVNSSPFQDKPRAVSSSMSNMSNVGFPSRIPNGIQTQIRSKSAKHRSLGMPRGDYRPIAASDSQILDLNGWRCISPEYYGNQNPFLVKVNNYQENNRKPQRFHYYGQTRINLDDPTGQFYQFENQKNLESSPRRQGGHTLESKNTNPTENLVLVRTARKHSATTQKGSRTLGYSKNGKVPSPPSSPFFPSDLFFRLQHHPRSITESTDMLQRFKESMLYQNGHGSVTVNGSHANNSAEERLVGPSERASPQREENQKQNNLYKSPVLDNFSKYSHVSEQHRKSEHETAKDDVEVNHITCPENQEPYVMDDRLTDLCGKKATPNDARKKTGELSLSEFFLVGIGNGHSSLQGTDNSVRRRTKTATSRRSVRFKVHDVIHEYEPWAPIQGQC